MDQQLVFPTRQGKSRDLCVKRTLSQDCTGIFEPGQPAAKLQCLRKDSRRQSAQPCLSTLMRANASHRHRLERAPAPAQNHVDNNQGTLPDNTTLTSQPQLEQSLLPRKIEVLPSSSHMNIQQRQVVMPVATPQMGSQINRTPQEQFLIERQQILAEQGNLYDSQVTPQQFAQLQANMHAQQYIKNYRQQMMQQHMMNQQMFNQQQNAQAQKQKFAIPQAYQAKSMHAQLAQMYQVQHQQQQQQRRLQNQQPTQPQQGKVLQGGPQTNTQQRQVSMAAAQASRGRIPKNMQAMSMEPRTNATQRYTGLFQQRLARLRQDMASRLMPQYGPPARYPPQVVKEYGIGLEQVAKGFVQDVMRRDRAEIAAHRQRRESGTISF